MAMPLLRCLDPVLFPGDVVAVLQFHELVRQVAMRAPEYVPVTIRHLALVKHLSGLAMFEAGKRVGVASCSMPFCTEAKLAASGNEPDAVAVAQLALVRSPGTELTA